MIAVADAAMRRAKRAGKDQAAEPSLTPLVALRSARR